MSDKKPASAQAAPVQTRKSGATFLGVFTALCVAVGGVVVMPTTLLFVVGMVPTAVAFFVDSSREKSLGPTVLFLNFSGVFPALMTLWQNGHTMANAIGILSDPAMLLLMLLPAGGAWMLYAYTPVVVSGMVRRKAEARIRSYERDQDALVEQWGGAVISGTKEL